MTDLIPIKRALISVSDKTDLVPLAKSLQRFGVKIISTGGTAKALGAAGLEVTTVEQVTQFPEMMDGRVKTLHPAIHGGLLALRDNKEHVGSMQQHGIEPIDLVCVNLYPFEKTIADPNVAESHAIENIDIGGPSMVRSASKNFQFVTVLTDPSQYDRLLTCMNGHDGQTTVALRRELAQAAFARMAAYDSAIAMWMGGQATHLMPRAMLLRTHRHPTTLRYGENPHQQGAMYVDPNNREASVARAKQLHGKSLSFCNLYDANGALELVKEIDGDKQAAAAVIKHANPCGFAVADDLADAFDKAYQGDPLAAFGGIVACNRLIDVDTAKHIVEIKSFLDVILAPGFDDEALTILKDRWKNTRLLEVGQLPPPDARTTKELDIKRITGGLLVQQRDLLTMDPGKWQHKAGPAPDAATLQQMRVGMIAVKHLKSNAVCIVNDNMLVGAGAGQMDRLASCTIAVQKAGQRAKGAIGASDALFPFCDGPGILIKAGVRAIVQTGGSMRDDETIAACDEAKVTLVFTGSRHFRH